MYNQQDHDILKALSQTYRDMSEDNADPGRARMGRADGDHYAAHGDGSGAEGAPDVKSDEQKKESEKVNKTAAEIAKEKDAERRRKQEEQNRGNRRGLN